MDNRLQTITDPSHIPIADGFSGELYSSIFNSMYDGLSFFEFRNDKVHALYLNESYFRTVGYTKEQYLPYLDNITVTLFEEDEELIRQCVEASLENDGLINTEVRGYRFDGSVGWFNIRAKLVNYVKSEYPVFVATVIDTTAKKRIEIDLSLIKERYRILEETTEIFLFEYKVFDDTMIFAPGKDKPHRIIRNYTRFMHTSPLVYEEDVPFFYATLTLAARKVMRGHIDYRTTSLDTGKYTWCRAYYSSVADDRGNVVSVLGRLENLEVDKYRIEAAKAPNPLYDGIDELTGLPRIRTAFKTLIDLLSNADQKTFLIIADIDDFAHFTQAYGTVYGDVAIKQTTELLSRSFEGSFIGRLRDDTFIICASGINEFDFHEITDKIAENSNIVHCGDIDVEYTLSFGASYPAQNLTDKLGFIDYFSVALRLLKQAKSEGKNKAFSEQITAEYFCF